MPTLRAITRTRRNANPTCDHTHTAKRYSIALSRNRFSGAWAHWTPFFFEETFTFSLEEATSISSTKNYLYVTFVTPVLCSYTLSARVLRPAKKQLAIKCTDLVFLVH